MPNVRAKATAEADADWPRKDDTHGAWSGQAVAAAAGRRLSEGLGVTEEHGCLWISVPRGLKYVLLAECAFNQCVRVFFQ